VNNVRNSPEDGQMSRQDEIAVELNISLHQAKSIIDEWQHYQCMKQIWCLALLTTAFLAIGMSAAQVPDLLGNWTAKWSSYDNEIGFSNSTANESLILAVSEQEERIFAGNITYEVDNQTKGSHGFAGAIGLDGKTLHIAEFDGGYCQGTMISSDEMELIYLVDGENGAAAIDRLYRIKE